MIWLRHSPIWSIAPPVAVFTIVSFATSHTPPFFSQSWNDRSRINGYAFNLWGIVAISEILSSIGGLSLIAPRSTTRACFVRTFSLISAAKCSRAFGVNADWQGPHTIASSISKIDHGFPVYLGQPNLAQSKSVSDAG